RANHPRSCQVLESKIFRFIRILNYGMHPPSPRHHEGTLARSSRNVGAGCDGRWGVSAAQAVRTKTPQRTAKSCGPGAATLASSRWSDRSATVARKAVHRGEHEVSRKTIARGKPGCLGCTCSSTRVLSLTTFRTRDCGRSRRPAFPAPSDRGGPTRLQNPGENESRERLRLFETEISK